MRANGKFLAIIPCMLGLLPTYVMDPPLLHFEAQGFISLYGNLTHCRDYCLYTRQMPEGYKSSENFCAVPEVWASNVNNLCIGIAYADSV